MKKPYCTNFTQAEMGALAMNTFCQGFATKAQKHGKLFDSDLFKIHYFYK